MANKKHWIDRWLQDENLFRKRRSGATAVGFTIKTQDKLW